MVKKSEGSGDHAERVSVSSAHGRGRGGGGRERVLLVRRGTEPLKGRWSLPGGLLELGESLADGVVREVKEETGLVVEPVELVELLDRIIVRANEFATIT